MRYYYLLFLTLCFLPAIAFAQAEATLTLSPKNPNPNENVTVTLSSYSFDVNTAKISWIVNGKTISSGEGKKSITLQLGNVGQEIPLRVEALLYDGSSMVQQITITPQTVDLIYESRESYTPPFYEGRSLPAEGSVVRVVAVPTLAENGKKLSEQNISYSWYVNGEHIARASGLGKTSIEVPIDYLRGSTAVKVLARSASGSVAEKELTVYPHAILPRLYKYDELLGTDLSQVYERRLELTEEITLSLVPWYMSVKGLEMTASYDWFVDGLPVTPQEKTILSLRPKENSYGVRTLTIAAKQTKRRLQEAEAALQIIFDTRK